MSSGGLPDEVEICGPRSAYVVSGPGPGLVTQALRKTSCIHSVILLDKVDKIRHSNFH